MDQNSPQYQQAIKAGFTPDQINQAIAAHGQSQTQPQPTGISPTDSFAPTSPITTTQPPQQNNNSSWADWLPTVGAVGGGLIGGLVGEGVGAVPGAGIGSALGESAKELIEGKSLNPVDIAAQGGLGAAGEGVGGLVAKGVGGILGKLGESSAVNGLNLTRLSLGKYAAQYGEPAAQTLMNNGLAGVDREGLMGGIQKVQQQFDTMANANVPVSHDTFLNNAINYLNKFQNSPVQSVQKVGDQLEQQITDLINKNPNGFTLSSLNAARKAFDGATADSQFGTANWGVNRATGQMLRDTVRQGATEAEQQGLLPGGSQLTQVGQNLSKLYDLADRSAGREASGAGGSPWSVTNLLSEIEAGGLASSMGVNPFVGGLTAFLGRKILSSPDVAQVASPLLTNAGGAIGGRLGQLTGGALTTAGITAAKSNAENGGTGGPGGTGGQTWDPQNFAKQLPTGVNVDTNGNAVLPPLTAHGVPQAITPQQYQDMLDKAGNNPILIDKINNLQKLSQDNANSFISNNKLSDQEQQDLRESQPLIQLANTVRQEMKGVPPDLFNNVDVINKLNSYNNPQYAQLSANLARLNDMVGRAVAGGVLRSMDLKAINKIGMGDGYGSANSKLDSVIVAAANRYTDLANRYGLNTQTQFSGQDQFPQ